ncbi:MAG TPA: methyltransferase [Tepidisphaeraceae bacterium]|jgi:ubiquinone/menaquinone biosynthesis C-methylase UbiE|nr:methyltransferase [Tepidisphaeraceae bacterium]
MAKPNASKTAVTPQRLFELSWGFVPTLMLQAAIENRVFDALDGGPKNIDQLATATGASKRGLRALVNALVGFGIIHRRKDRFTLAPDTAAFMVSTKPGFLGGIVHHMTGQLLDNFRHLPEIVRTGKPATPVNQQKKGSEFFSKFVESLFNLSYPVACALADHLAPKLPKNGRVNILDIAAGSGVWGFGVAQRFPQSQITAVDWPAVLPVTRRIAKRQKLADRLRTIEGDILQADYGNGFHVATLGAILHSEGEARSRKLLKKVFDALAPGGVIAIAEFVPNEDRTGPPYPLLFAVNMLVHTDEGDTFTFKEMTGWLKQAGFQKIRQVKVPAPFPLLVASKP